MEKLFKDYHDIAEFRLVYINEAHAADSDWSVPYAAELGINDHTTYGERCEVASKLLDDKNLTIPTVIDAMDNKVNKAYSAWPDRIFVVAKDGRLAIAADRGPRGYVPALKKTAAWLKEYRENGVEPALPDDAVAADYGMPKLTDLAGTWELSFEFEDRKMTGEMVVGADGLTGSVSIENENEPTKLHGVVLVGRNLRMKVTTPDNQEFEFEGTLGDGDFEGVWTGQGEGMTIACTGTKKEI